MAIPKITAITALLVPNEAPNGQHLYGLGEDSQIYEWNLKQGVWHIAKLGSKLDFKDL